MISLFRFIVIICSCEKGKGFVFDYYSGFWNSLSHGLSIFQEGKSGEKDSLKLEKNAESSKVLFLVSAIVNYGETSSESVIYFY